MEDETRAVDVVAADERSERASVSASTIVAKPRLLISPKMEEDFFLREEEERAVRDLAWRSLANDRVRIFDHATVKTLEGIRVLAFQRPRSRLSRVFYGIQNVTADVHASLVIVVVNSANQLKSLVIFLEEVLEAGHQVWIVPHARFEVETTRLVDDRVRAILSVSAVTAVTAVTAVKHNDTTSAVSETVSKKKHEKSLVR